MASYRAPLHDISFVLRELATIEAIANLPGFEETADVLDPVLTEAATFASEVLDPLNVVGDRVGCTWKDGEVTTPPGFKDAYRQFAQAGWLGLAAPAEYGGQALPRALLGAVTEMWHGASAGFSNSTLLNQGAIEAIKLAGTEQQKRTYLPRLVSGTWAGAMCLTEPQAGSDLAAVRTKAVPDGDCHKISGQKIFITFGEHDFTSNIVHLVLARLPGAPEGTKGISLFIVPKFLFDVDGSLGDRNDVHCAGIEHKLGLHGNPTCTIGFGEKTGGATGYLVGEPNRGLETMFIMMNVTRLSTGIQAIGIADRAYQSALAYAKERIQRGRIIEHPDVRRMLMSMKSQIEAMRALAYVTAASIDLGRQAFVDFMIPIVKAWCTETATELCSTAVQVFGGMGYIEETGIAQQYRDIKVASIYEGTTGIQALDLVGRKLLRDNGTSATQIIAEIVSFARTLDEGDADLAAIKGALEQGVDALAGASNWIGTTGKTDLPTAVACSVPYLKLWGVVAGGWQMARAAKIAAARIAAGDPESAFYGAKLTTARFYAAHVLSQSPWLQHQILDGSAGVMRLNEEGYDLDRRGLASAVGR